MLIKHHKHHPIKLDPSQKMNAPKTPDTEDEETLPNSPLLLIDILTPIVCTPAPLRFCWVEPPTKFSKRGGLDSTSTFRGGCWERGD